MTRLRRLALAAVTVAFLPAGSPIASAQDAANSGASSQVAAGAARLDQLFLVPLPARRPAALDGSDAPMPEADAGMSAVEPAKAAAAFAAPIPAERPGDVATAAAPSAVPPAPLPAASAAPVAGPPAPVHTVPQPSGQVQMASYPAAPLQPATVPPPAGYSVMPPDSPAAHLFPAAVQADMVVVHKSRRLMHLVHNRQIIRTYHIALGAPSGHKLRQGDRRTPEGVYTIDWRNPSSAYHLALHISYPRPIDAWSAANRNVDAGSAIMIHGMPNGRTPVDMGHPWNDWTDGCIAVTDAEIEEIWTMVADGTPITIFP